MCDKNTKFVGYLLVNKTDLKFFRLRSLYPDSSDEDMSDCSQDTCNSETTEYADDILNEIAKIPVYFYEDV